MANTIRRYRDTENIHNCELITFSLITISSKTSAPISIHFKTSWLHHFYRHFSSFNCAQLSVPNFDVNFLEVYSFVKVFILSLSWALSSVNNIPSTAMAPVITPHSSLLHCHATSKGCHCPSKCLFIKIHIIFFISCINYCFQHSLKSYSLSIKIVFNLIY